MECNIFSNTVAPLLAWPAIFLDTNFRLCLLSKKTVETLHATSLQIK
jgi:hypothetical protein